MNKIATPAGIVRTGNVIFFRGAQVGKVTGFKKATATEAAWIFIDQEGQGINGGLLKNAVHPDDVEGIA